MERIYQVRKTAWGQHQVWNILTNIPMHMAEGQRLAERRAEDLNQRAAEARAARRGGSK